MEGTDREDPPIRQISTPGLRFRWGTEPVAAAAPGHITKLAMAEGGGLPIESPVSSLGSPPMEEPPALGGNWSELPADILNVVQCELEFPDLFRSATVCTSWRAAARSLLSNGLYSRPQTPCLLYSTAAAGPRAAELYSLADRSTYTLRLPDPPIADRNIVGSSHGWLVTADARSELHLLNPATGEQLELPPVATIEQVSPVFDGAGNLERYDLYFYDGTLPREENRPPQPYAVDQLRQVLYLKVVLSCDPSRGDCTLMMIHNPYRQLSFAKVGGDRWHWVTTSFTNSRYSDCIYHDGAFCAMNLQGGIHRYTIDGSCATRNIIFKNTLPYTAYNMYTAQTSSADVLQIWRITMDAGVGEQEELHTTSIETRNIARRCRAAQPSPLGHRVRAVQR
ncbi:hypothetical protein ACP70R_020064 [Stipagrostis hirtigluma subsp. patula]